MHIRSLQLLHDTFLAGNCYPFNLDVIQNTDRLEFSSPLTFFIGENGSGISTLIRAIARS